MLILILWYGRNNMTETQKSEFNWKKAGLIAGGIIAGVAVVGPTVTNAIQDGERQAQADEKEAAAEAYENAVQAAVNAAYDRKEVVDEIHVIQSGPVLIDAAEDILKASLGEEVYKENRGRLYDLLQDTAQVYTSTGDPQPGSTFYVVETDFDHNPENGKEYIVTDGKGGIIEEPTDTIPSPQQIDDTQLPTLDQ